MQGLLKQHERARRRGVNPIVYWLIRGVLQPFFHLYFRLSRIGREHIPDDGPVIFASNHRSFLDPFLIGTLVRRPIYYVAKRELFSNRLQAWLLKSLGAFPVDRGHSDSEMIATAKAILARGDCVVIFPEGTRVRPGPLGHAKRGVGRLALETAAPVVPLAVIGSEDVRRGWRIRPRKIRIRVGRPLTFPRVQSATPQLAQAVTDRIWPCVMLQWEWLGGLAPLRRVAVVGASEWGRSVAEALRRAGVEIEAGVAGACEVSECDLLCLAVPAAELPPALAAELPALPQRAGVLVVSEGLVPPEGLLPGAYLAGRAELAGHPVACLAGPSQPADLLVSGTTVLLASSDRGLARQLSHALRAAGVDSQRSADLAGVELGAASTALGGPASGRHAA
ncbi:MAG: 1-acyl-sn-glycerol-3-phosphate acyltransferase [Solirubrobacteraceae bacterium]|nr:MAG: hypothetical protein DLM63_04550 [Solirubrobacterales bacterium]